MTEPSLYQDSGGALFAVYSPIAFSAAAILFSLLLGWVYPRVTVETWPLLRQLESAAFWLVPWSYAVSILFSFWALGLSIKRGQRLASYFVPAFLVHAVVLGLSILMILAPSAPSPWPVWAI